MFGLYIIIAMITREKEIQPAWKEPRFVVRGEEFDADEALVADGFYLQVVELEVSRKINPFPVQVRGFG